MSLTNARYYARGRFFWDERAETLEAQVLAPIQDPIEMGLPLEALEEKLRAAPYYPPLFERAYGTRAITADRIARALAQFMRALVSSRSPYDEARAAGPPGSPAFAARLTETERLGHRLFVAVPGAGVRATGCGRCHVTGAQTSLSPRNIGLDPAGSGDEGTGDGRFKAPSLRNVAVRGPFMHDGRFATLSEVIAHYNAEVQPHPFLDMTLLDRRLAVTGGTAGPAEPDRHRDRRAGCVPAHADRRSVLDRPEVRGPVRACRQQPLARVRLRPSRPGDEHDPVLQRRQVPSTYTSTAVSLTVSPRARTPRRRRGTWSGLLGTLSEERRPVTRCVRDTIG